MYRIRTAVVFALQSWLAETPAKKKASSTPGYFSVAMACSSLSPLRFFYIWLTDVLLVMALFMGYLPLFLPPVPNRAGTGTEAPAAAPPS